MDLIKIKKYINNNIRLNDTIIKLDYTNIEQYKTKVMLRDCMITILYESCIDIEFGFVIDGIRFLSNTDAIKVFDITKTHSFKYEEYSLLVSYNLSNPIQLEYSKHSDYVPTLPAIRRYKIKKLLGY